MEQTIKRAIMNHSSRDTEAGHWKPLGTFLWTAQYVAMFSVWFCLNDHTLIIHCYWTQSKERLPNIRIFSVGLSTAFLHWITRHNTPPTCRKVTFTTGSLIDRQTTQKQKAWHQSPLSCRLRVDTRPSVDGKHCQGTRETDRPAQVLWRL